MQGSEMLEGTFYHSDWMTLVLLLCAFLVWSVWKNAGGFLEQKSFEVMHDYGRKSLFSSDTLSELRIGAVLGVVHVLIVSLFIHHLLAYFNFGSGFMLYLAICCLVVIYHAAKIIVINYWNYLVSAKEQKNIWVKNYTVFNLILGLVLIPVVVVITYTRQQTVEMGLNIGIFILVLYLLTLFVRSINIFFSNLSSFIYLILYFCSLEILPLLLAVKVVLKSV